MELDTLANFEVPCLGPVTSFPAFRQFRNQIAIWGNFGQIVAQLAELYVQHVVVKDLTRVQHVAGGAAGHALAKASALFWCGQSTLHVQSRRHGAQSHRRNTGEKFPSAQLTFGHSGL